MLLLSGLSGILSFLLAAYYPCIMCGSARLEFTCTTPLYNMMFGPFILSDDGPGLGRNVSDVSTNTVN